jgi:hypothetical protein
MNNSQREMIERLQAMSLDNARTAVATAQFGSIGSPDHEFCVAWLAAQDARLGNARNEEQLGLSRRAVLASERATRIAILALILSLIAAAAALLK